MKRGISWLLGLAIVGGVGAAALQIPAVQDRLFIEGTRYVFTERADRQALFADDGLRVLICGSSGPLPTRTRAKSCTAVIAGGKFYVVDIGSEATENFGMWLFPLDRIGAVFITHLHSDHIGELAEINLQSWVQGRPGPLDVYGPPGIERVVSGFTEAYAADTRYRNAHHGSGFLPLEKAVMNAHPVLMPEPETDKLDRVTPAFTDGDLKVTAIEVNHHQVHPAYAYRFDYHGRSVVISGDTVYHPPLAVAAKGADVLIHEAQSEYLFRMMQQAGQGMKGLDRFNELHGMVSDYHASAADAAQIANQAGVRLLVLSHLMPPDRSSLVLKIMERGMSAVRSEGVVTATDGMLITLPAQSDAINVKQID